MMKHFNYKLFIQKLVDSKALFPGILKGGTAMIGSRSVDDKKAVMKGLGIFYLKRGILSVETFYIFCGEPCLAFLTRPEMRLNAS